MSRIILHHKGAYNIYTTIADGACFVSALTLKQLKQHIKEEHGESGLRQLPERLKRAHEKGTSSLIDKSLRETILCNRAGEHEKHLSQKEFIKRFLTL